MDDFTDSDQNWADLLQGKEAPNASPRARYEAEALKRAYQIDAALQQRQQMIADHQAASGHPDHRYQKLQFALRKEGIKLSVAKPFYQSYPAIGMAAAVLMATMISLQAPPVDETAYYDPPAGLRGEVISQVVNAFEPKLAAESLAKQLKDAGVSPVTIYQAQTTFTVEFEATAANLPAVNQVLSKHQIKLEAGVQRVEFSRAWWQRFAWLSR